MPARKRVAILGAGPSGLAAAFALAKTGQYDIHIYQSGWRAGGKCATGREQPSGRALQNGSHYLFGCCYNAFKLIREAYQVLDQLPAEERDAFGSFEEEFVARNLLVSTQRYQRPGTVEDEPWFRYLPQNMSTPGQDDKLPSAFDYVAMGVQFGIGFAVDSTLALLLAAGPGRDRFEGVRACLRVLPLCPFEPSRWARVVRGVLTPVRWSFDQLLWRALAEMFRAGNELNMLAIPLGWRDALARGRLRAIERATAATSAAIKHLLEGSAHLPKRLSNICQRNLILLDLATTLLVGYYRDRLYEPGGLATIEKLDLRDWLRQNGASEQAVGSALITTWYDAVVSYKRGDQDRPMCSAGVAVQAILRAVLTYKGAFAFQMRAEVGDSYIAPIVRALEHQGVHFHFFERVRRLVVDPHQQYVCQIELDQQCHNPPPRAQFVEVRDHAKGGRMRKAWPAQPLCDVCASQTPPIDSYYSTHRIGQRVIHARTEHPHDAEAFDLIVSALPCGVLEDVLVDRGGASVTARAEAWRECFTNIDFTESQAIRMWFKWPLRKTGKERSLGWLHDSPILSGYTWPHSTWEDNSQARDIHNFPEDQLPLTIATLFGPLASGAGDCRHADYVTQQQKAAADAAQIFLEKSMLGLWPGIGDADQAIDWDAFVDLDKGTGDARFKWQRVAANVGPNESYVFAEPDKLKHRLRADESGIANLFLAGDWTRNGVEVGSLEGAVMSGFKAARAIHGDSVVVLGGDDFDRGSLFRR